MAFLIKIRRVGVSLIFLCIKHWGKLIFRTFLVGETSTPFEKYEPKWESSLNRGWTSKKYLSCHHPDHHRSTWWTEISEAMLVSGRVIQNPSVAQILLSSSFSSCRLHHWTSEADSRPQHGSELAILLPCSHNKWTFSNGEGCQRKVANIHSLLLGYLWKKSSNYVWTVSKQAQTSHKVHLSDPWFGPQEIYQQLLHQLRHLHFLRLLRYRISQLLHVSLPMDVPCLDAKLHGACYIKPKTTPSCGTCLYLLAAFWRSKAMHLIIFGRVWIQGRHWIVKRNIYNLSCTSTGL